jgi:hypothetical protein
VKFDTTERRLPRLKRQVQFVLRVGKNPKLSDLSGQKTGLGLPVLLVDAQQYHQALPDPAGNTALGFNAGAADALYHGTQRPIPLYLLVHPLDGEDSRYFFKIRYNEIKLIDVGDAHGDLDLGLVVA